MLESHEKSFYSELHENNGKRNLSTGHVSWFRHCPWTMSGSTFPETCVRCPLHPDALDSLSRGRLSPRQVFRC